MSNENAQRASGLLLEWPKGPVERTALTEQGTIAYSGPIPNTHWEQYVFTSGIALRHEDHFGSSPPYRYQLTVRRSGSRILILGPTMDVVYHLVDQIINRSLTPRLRHVSIAVDQLAKAIVEKPTVYVLSFAHARLPAFGTSLRSISLYGDDLGESSLLRDNIGLMTVFTCGLRKAIGGSEVVRLSGDGAVSFYLTEPERVLEVETVLSFLRQHEYLSTPLWEE